MASSEEILRKLLVSAVKDLLRFRGPKSDIPRSEQALRYVATSHNHLVERFIHVRITNNNRITIWSSK
jgi:hypothetical protein